MSSILKAVSLTAVPIMIWYNVCSGKTWYGSHYLYEQSMSSSELISKKQSHARCFSFFYAVGPNFTHIVQISNIILSRKALT